MVLISLYFQTFTKTNQKIIVSKKILIYSPGAFKKVGHCFDYCQGLTSSFSKLGYQSTIIGLDGPLNYSNNVVQLKKFASPETRKTGMIDKVKWGLDRVKKQKLLFQAFVEEANSDNNYDFALLETFEYLSAAKGVEELKLPYLAIFHDTNFNFKQTNIVAALYKTACKSAGKKIVKHAVSAFVHGDKMKTNLLKTLRITDKEAVQVIPYGAKTPVRLSEEQKERFLKKNGLDHLEASTQFMLTFGTLRSDKHFEPIIQALKNKKNWHWLVAGPEGDLAYSELESMVKKHKIENQFTAFKGFIEAQDQPEFFAAADVVVNLYKAHIRHESGTVQLARQFCTPVIVGGPEDLTTYVEANKLGWVLPHHNALCSTLETIEVLDPAKKEELSRNIEEFAHNRSWDKVVDIILKKRNQQPAAQKA